MINFKDIPEDDVYRIQAKEFHDKLLNILDDDKIGVQITVMLSFISMTIAQFNDSELTLKLTIKSLKNSVKHYKDING